MCKDGMLFEVSLISISEYSSNVANLPAYKVASGC